MLLGRIWTPVFLQIDLKNATISLRDGSTPANELEIKIGGGNLTYTESRNMEYTLDRGTLDEVREGDEVPMDVSLDFTWEYLKGATGSGTPSVEDVLKNQGEAAAWVSSDTDTCRPFAVDIVLLHVPSCGVGADADQETVILPDFRYESLDHDLREGTVSISGRCNATAATVTREAQPST